jgi:hypothetical protein
VTVGHLLGWLSAVLAGNVVGGVMIVAVLNYGQVRAGDADTGDKRSSWPGAPPSRDRHKDGNPGFVQMFRR